MPNTTPTIPNFPPQGIQAQLDLLYLYNPDAANKLIEQLEAGLIKIEELQKEIEKALQDMQGVLRYKGSVQTEADLPTEGNVIGDVWNIISTDENVAWTGTEWDKFGSTIDTSKFLTTDGGVVEGILSIAKSGELRFPNSASGSAGGIIRYAANQGFDFGYWNTTNKNFTSLATLQRALGFNPAPTQDGKLKLGRDGQTWAEVWAKKVFTAIINNGADINIPNKPGTLALLEDIAPGITEQWVKDNFINSDASTYTLATLQDAFNYSAARLYKIFNEDKMPTKNTFTLFSLGWTYNDTNNMPTLLASDLQTGKFYFYHGDYENCSPNTWQEFTFGGDALAQEVETNKNDLADLGDQVHDIEAKIPADASATNQLATKADITSGSGLPDQTGHTGFLQTDGTNATWSDKEPIINNVNINTNGGVGVFGNAYLWGVALGSNSATGVRSIAIGYNAQATAADSIAIGYGCTNAESKTIKYKFVGDVDSSTLLKADGTIPSERLAASGTTGQVLSKTDTGMQWVDMGGASGDYLPLSGGSLTGPLIAPTPATNASFGVPVLSLRADVTDGTIGTPVPITVTPNGVVVTITSTVHVNSIGWSGVGSGNIGSTIFKWKTLYCTKLNNGADIAIPTTGGTMALVEDLQAVTEAAHLANGVKGDYCSTYAVIKAPNGRPKIKTGATNTVTIPAGMVFDCPLSTDPNDTSTGLITWATQEDVEITETTTDCFLVYVHALGEFKVCNKICFTPAQPEEGTDPCMMWFNGEYWQLKSDDTGNVWRKTRAHPVCKCIFTNGVLTRLNYIGWYDIPEDVA